MKKNIFWESFVSIILSITIISIIFIGLYQIIDYNNKIDYDFKKSNYINILQTNTEKIINKIDLSIYNEWSKIYISQDKDNKIEMKTDQKFWYINELWINVDINSKWLVFFRECKIKTVNSLKTINCVIK